MYLTWCERLAQQPQLRDITHWPVIPLDALPRARRKAFVRNQAIVAQILSGARQQAVARRHNVSQGRVSQLLSRCLAGEDTTAPSLTAGLLPYHGITERHRVGPVNAQTTTHGHTCAFKSLLEVVPGLRDGLDAMILAKLKDAAYAQRLTPRTFHGEFKRILAERQWPRDRYPYTTISVGYSSVHRYLRTRIAELMAEREQRRQERIRPPVSSPQPYRALRAVQIDEHILDLNGRVNLQLDDQLIPLRLARASVLVAVDVDTECILGYYLTPTRSPNQQDMLTLIERCLRPWQPGTLRSPGLQYTPGACFPSGLAGAFPISFGTVQLDNALIHQAHSVAEQCCQHLGATLSLGWPAMPQVRHQVESVFRYINDHCSHRVASTTGSHPTDPIGESRKNRKAPPLITFETLDEALSVILTNSNVTPSPSRGNVSPLALFQEHCANHFVRYLPPAFTQQWHPLAGSAEVRVHWYLHEHRTPHVNFYHARYQGPGLLRIAAKGKSIRVMFDRRDVRTLQAYTLAGEPLGELTVSRPWQRYPHSIATRQWIHRNAREYRFGLHDPLGDYFRYLLEQRGKPKMALSLLRVYTEFTAGRPEGLVLGEATEDATAGGKRVAARRQWHPNIADTRPES